MNNQEMQEGFEAAFVKATIERGKERSISPDGITLLRAYLAESLVDDRDGETYKSAHNASAWWAWQASRAALVIELPAKISPYNTMDNGFVSPEAEHYDEAVDDCREAIASTGLRVKP